MMEENKINLHAPRILDHIFIQNGVLVWHRGRLLLNSTEFRMLIYLTGLLRKTEVRLSIIVLENHRNFIEQT